MRLSRTQEFASADNSARPMRCRPKVSLLDTAFRPGEPDDGTPNCHRPCWLPAELVAPQPNIAVGFSSALHANEAVDERLRTKLSRVVLPPLIARLLCRINDGVRQPEPRHALPAIQHHHAATASRQRAIGSGD